MTFETTKESIILYASSRTGCSHRTVRDVTEALFDGITLELSEGNSVIIRGFGTFAVKKRAKRVGRNINTGERVEIPERFVPSFKPGVNLKRVVSELT